MHWVFTNSHLNCDMLKGRLETFRINGNVLAYIRHGFNLLHLEGVADYNVFVNFCSKEGF